MSADPESRIPGYIWAFRVFRPGAEGSSVIPLTTTLNYGVIGPDGGVQVRIIYDHRTMDGATVARALACLEAVLHGPIADELADLSCQASEGSRNKTSPAIAASHSR